MRSSGPPVRDAPRIANVRAAARSQAMGIRTLIHEAATRRTSPSAAFRIRGTSRSSSSCPNRPTCRPPVGRTSRGLGESASARYAKANVRICTQAAGGGYRFRITRKRRGPDDEESGESRTPTPASSAGGLMVRPGCSTPRAKLV
jgi:hypothetical protein